MVDKLFNVQAVYLGGFIQHYRSSKQMGEEINGEGK